MGRLQLWFTAVSTRHFDIIRLVKIIYGNHILLGQGFEKDVLPLCTLCFESDHPYRTAVASMNRL